MVRLEAALVADGWTVSVVDDVLRVAAGASRAADLNMVTFVSGGGSLPPGAPGVAFRTLAGST